MLPETRATASPLQQLTVPISIVIAGVLIAAAVFFSSGGSNTGGGGQTTTTVAPIEIAALQGNDHVRGSRDAKVLMIEFSDTECPFCKRFDETARQVYEKYSGAGDVAWVYRHFPIPSLHPKAPKEAEAMECAAEQGGDETFWKFSDAIFSTTESNNSLDIGIHNTPKPTPEYYTEKAPRSSTDAGQLSDIAVSLGLNKAQFESCLTNGTQAARVQRDVEDAGKSGGAGTPHTVFVSKSKIGKDTKQYLDSLIPTMGGQTFVISDDEMKVSMSGALPFEVVDQLLQTLLK